jgi:hypothetical protein
MSHTERTPSRRGLLAGATAALAAGAAIATAAHAAPVAAPGGAGDDAELISICHRFAEQELDDWYRYVTAPAETADDLDDNTDWDILQWITATPATTSQGWHAKALAYTAWHHEAYDDEPMNRDSQSPLLAALLRDMVAPVRNAIVARLAAKYGPLPDGYTPGGSWLGRASA